MNPAGLIVGRCEGSNFWYDQATIRVMYALTELTGDAKFADAADRYTRAVYQHAVKENGLIVWGTHIYYDAYADKPAGDGDRHGPHETLVYPCPVAATLSRRAPRRRGEPWTRSGSGTWSITRRGSITDMTTSAWGCDFAFSGGAFAQANAAIYQQTRQQQYLDRAKTIANWHWQHRNPETLLVPDAPSTGSRYDANHCFTTVPGPYAAYLLNCYELTDDKWFRDVAVSCLKAYHKWGYDNEARTYHAMLKLDGHPVSDQSRGSGYDAWAPYGHVDLWKTTIYSYEFPLIAAQSYVYGYELTQDEHGNGDPQLLEAAKCWADVIEKNLPPKVGRRWAKEITAALPEVEKTGGSYAEDYGRTISFFIHLYHATGERRYLELAEKVARDRR